MDDNVLIAQIRKNEGDAAADAAAKLYAKFEPGLPIDVNRLFWFIADRRFKQPHNPYGRGYNDAIDELDKWLRDGGYEPRTG